jgi:hypothetical protein
MFDAVPIATVTNLLCQANPSLFPRLRKVMEVIEMARRAKENGSTRFCMGTLVVPLLSRKHACFVRLRMIFGYMSIE